MTSRGKSAVRGFETEIEKSREEGNWKKVVELAQQLKQRSPQHESLAHFLMGEGKLEAYLEECPPAPERPECAERAARELGAARGLLALAADAAGRRAGVALDAHLLLGKLQYACGQPEEALQHFQHAELDTLTEKELPVRSLRIVAESFAIKGLCVEQLGAAPAAPASRYKASERELEAVRAFELCAELTVLYLQRARRAAGPVLGGALPRAALLHARARRLPRALRAYRALLAAAECAHTAPLRLPLARGLAELLLRAAPGPAYTPPDQEPDGPWKPRKYSAPNQFVPRCEWEELLLVLGVGEALAVRDAVLSQSAEFRAARDAALAGAAGVADLLALAAARWGLLALVLECLERAMKFSHGSAHVWRQRALATAAHAQAQRPGSEAESAAAVRAAGVMSRAMPLAPGDTALRLLHAHTAYRMGWIEEGIAASEEAVSLQQAAGGPLAARACLAAGVGLAARAQRAHCRRERERAAEASVARLQQAAQLDAGDHRALYELGLGYARGGRLNAAMDAVRGCLAARPECASGLRLAIALWSCACAGPRSLLALQTARLARQHYPRADWPLAALATLQVSWESGEAALATGKELLALLHGGEEGEEGGEAGGGGGGYCALDAASEAGSWRAAPRALSDTASSASRTNGAGAGGGTERALGWLTLAELCVRLRRPAAAAGCVAEAAALAPRHHRVLHTRGVVQAASGQWEAARGSFTDALALCPTHVDTIVQLGATYYALGWLRLAEKTLREAAALAPRRADTWRRLALVLRALRDPLAAADCAAAALRLQPAACDV